MGLKLYSDLMSQPCRSLYILLKVCGIQFEEVPLDLLKGAHHSDDFTKINRFNKVPVIEHDGFVLTESIAIIRYLANSKLIPDNLYPSDPNKQARVDEFLEWHHAGLRLPCAMFFLQTHLVPTMTGNPAKPKIIEKYKNGIEAALDLVETKWLGRGYSFLVSDNLTVADLWALCELEQPRMAGYDPCEGRTNLSKWRNTVRNAFNPHYEEAHVIVNKIVNREMQKKQTSKI